MTVLVLAANDHVTTGIAGAAASVGAVTGGVTGADSGVGGGADAGAETRVTGADAAEVAPVPTPFAALTTNV